MGGGLTSDFSFPIVSQFYPQYSQCLWHLHSCVFGARIVPPNQNHGRAPAEATSRLAVA